MSTCRWAIALIGLSALVVGCGSQAEDGVSESQQRVISGTDDREDAYQFAGQPALLNSADGVAVLAYASALVPSNGSVSLSVQSFQSGYNMCPSARFAAEPLVNGGHCTVYLVAPRLVATAGHCTGFAAVGSDESQFDVVFGFRMLDATDAQTTVPTSEVYTAVKVAAVCDNSADCTVLQLDRPVTNHHILPVRRSGAPAIGDNVYIMGYPFTLPLKYDGVAPLTNVYSSANILAAALDIAGGNSGSPIFNATSNVVEGTLNGYSSSGATDLDSTSAGCNVEHVATAADNYVSTGWGAVNYTAYVPPYCSGDAGGWAACGGSGCGVCAQQLDTTKYNLYLQHHPNCTLDSTCSAGAFTACSEACPAPTAADSDVGLPDLVVSGVSWTPASIAAGQNATFTATVKNQGTAATKAGVIVGVRFDVDGTAVSWSDNDTASLAPGASVTVTANSGPTGRSTWSAVSGLHTLQAWVDDVNRITESNESNNKTTVSLPIGIDLKVSSISYVPASPASGNAVTFLATVKNQGTVATPAGVIIGVRFDIDGTAVTWSDNDTTSLLPGASVTVTANSGPTGRSTWTATSGTHTLQAWVDDVNRMTDVDRSNNKLVTSLTIH